MEKLVDDWYDALNDCYANQMNLFLKLSYIQAINEFDY